MNKPEYKRPKCYTPEPQEIYPLCLGQKGWACEKCCLYRNYEQGKQMTLEDLTQRTHGEDKKGR